MNKKPESDIFSTVVNHGYCIGCGVCAAFDANISIVQDDYGRLVAERQETPHSLNQKINAICPFGDNSLSEDEIAEEAFGSLPYDKHIGRYKSTYAGWVSESDFRANGSSGGFVTWLLVELLKVGKIDYVVHVVEKKSATRESPLFAFSISSTPDDVRKNAKSRYYPVEMSGVIKEIINTPGRYAVVGIPCFIKGLRLATFHSEVLKERLAFTVGIVCGHLKTTAFSELLAWQVGFPPGELRSIDFRTKLPGHPANRYAATFNGRLDGKEQAITTEMSKLFGGNWGHGFFKYKACDFCDDVIGETADVSVGDAWLPEYVNDSGGANIIVVRSPFIDDIVKDGIVDGRLSFDSIPVEKVFQSQAGGFRHRRDGLGFRLHLEDQAGRWRPTKRVSASTTGLSQKERRVYSMRAALAEASHHLFAEAKRRNSLNFFLERMKKMTTKYEDLRSPSMAKAVARRLRSKLKRFLSQR